MANQPFIRGKNQRPTTGNFNNLIDPKDPRITSAHSLFEVQKEAEVNFNNNIMQTARMFGGNLTNALNVDLDDLKLNLATDIGGDDPRQDELDLLVGNFTARQNQILKSFKRPGLTAQTRNVSSLG